MNELFNNINQLFNSINFNLVISIIIAIFGIIAVKFAITFDLNKFLERRDERLKSPLQNICPHLELSTTTKEGEFAVNSLYETFYGVTYYRCKKCGHINYHPDEKEIQEMAKYYLLNINEYKKRHNQFNKILKKLGML